MGDTPINPFDLLGSVDAITAFFKNLAGHKVAPIAAGGDHTITLPILRGLYKGQPFGAVHFDAHADTLDTYLGTKINHATPFRRLVEEGILDPKRTIQIGLRGTRFGDDDIQYGYDVGMRIVTMDDFEEMGREEVNAGASAALARPTSPSTSTASIPCTASAPACPSRAASPCATPR
jgi:guanidinopropionase